MSRKPLLTLDQYEQIRNCARARAAIPSAKQLARSLGVSPRIVEYYIRPTKISAQLERQLRERRG